MKVSELLEERFILTDFKSDDKKDIINELIDLHKEDNNVNDLEKVRTAIHDREKEMSTGIGKGFAIPHGKTNAVNDVIVSFGKTTSDIDYEALDGNPVHLVFLLVGKVDLVSKYIKLLSRISRVMNKDDFRDKLLNAKTKDEIINIFKEEEKQYFDV
ncbi:MAG: PTS sugar transporter subunit IIA [Bacteroidetes bacterium]|nr:PTS sugar transporter subunit IIA [Bacteroidota bacterium]MCH7771554.1 PTS sugar transporter subunit IIA [Bacteroidota bacterium]